MAQFHRPQTHATARCGRRTDGDGASRQSVPVFQTQEEDTDEEDEIEKKMDEGDK